MTQLRLATAVRHLRQTLADQEAATQADRELLQAFTRHRDSSAFTTIVGRYGSLVFGICRRELANEQDAEDAFQATFLALVQQATSIRQGESLAGWLHGVSYRIAMKAKREAARRRVREGKSKSTTPPSPANELAWREVQVLLDEEVQRLPEIYRGPFVLCCLEGVSHADAARRLGLKEGTIASRLATARKRLRGVLSRKGITLSAVLAALSLSGNRSAAVPKALADRTCKALVDGGKGSVEGLSAKVLSLAEGAMKTMLATKMKLATILLLALTLLGAGVSVFCLRGATAREPTVLANPLPENTTKQQAQKPEQPKAEKLTITGTVVDAEGKPVRGARVSIWAGGKAEPEATTAADGTFRLIVEAGQVKGGAKLIATAAGLGPDWLDVGSDRKQDNLTLRLVKDEVPITGRVLDLEGRPVAGAAVSATDIQALADGGSLDPYVNHWKKYTNERYIPAEATRYPFQMKTAPTEALGLAGVTRTDKEGRFRLTGFGQERLVSVRIEGEGIATVWQRVVTRPKPEDPPLRMFLNASFEVLAEPGKSIAGTVRERGSGKPVAGLRVTCGTGRTVTDDEGRYKINGLQKRDRYLVTPSGSPYFFTMREAADTPGLETIRFDFEVDRALELRGRLIDKETGRPIAGRVQYVATADNPHLKDYPDLGDRRTSPSSGRADADGQFRLPVIPGQGWICITARDEDHYTGVPVVDWDKPFVNAVPHSFHVSRFHAVIPVTIDPKDRKSLLLDVALRPGVQRKGKLVDPDGKPVGEAYSAGLRPITVKDGLFNPCEPLSDHTFSASGLDPESERPVVFYHLGKKLARVLPISGKDRGELTIKLEPMGGISGRFLDSDGKPMAGVRVQVELTRHINSYKDMPYDLLHGHLEKLKVVQMTDRDGRFNLDLLVPGLKYNLVFSDGEIKRGTQIYYHKENLTVVAGKTTDLGDIRQSKSEDR